MKSRKISISHWFVAGSKDMFCNLDKKPITAIVIEHLQENGTDILFFKAGGALYYTYPSCIVEFH